MMRNLIVLAALLLCAMPSRAWAQTGGTAAFERFVIFGGGGYQWPDEEFGEAMTFQQYLEPATVESRYQLRDTSLIDAAVGIPLAGPLMVHAGASVTTRRAAATLVGSIPDPFQFNQPRAVGQPIDDVTHREVAIRGELAWGIPMGGFLLTLSGGPVAINVQHTFAAEITVRELEYPFGTPALDVGTLDEQRDWAFGGTAAVDLSWYPSLRFGVGVTGRFTAASLEMRDVSVEAGGPSVAVGVRVRP